VRPTDEYGEQAGNDEGNEEGDTVLTRAARRGRSGVVRVLVASGKGTSTGLDPTAGCPSRSPSFLRTPRALRRCFPRTASTPTRRWT